MKIIENLIQGSDKWHEFRKSHIGASESAAIIGMSPYQTPFKKWEEKTGRSFGIVENEAMKLGSEMEPKIRSEWEFYTGKKFDTPTAEHDEFSFMSASFDGYCHEDGSIIEIKYSKHHKLSECISLADVEHLKELYPHYFVQCQHLMCVANADKCSLITMTPTGQIIDMEVPKDVEFIEQKLMPELKVFWCEYVLKDKEPPLSDKDFLHVSDDDSLCDAQEWIYINQRIKEMQEREKELRKRLIDRGEGNNVIVGNMLKVTSYTSTRVDYRKACEDNEIDILSYKKVSTKSYRFTPIVQK